MKYFFVSTVFLFASAIVACADEPASIQPLLQTYCVCCHGAEEQEGDLRLDELSSATPELLTRIYEQLSSGQMPPDDARQPPRDQRDQMARHFLSLAKQTTTASTAALRRMNKREYGNTVRDLLGLRDGIFDPGKFIYDDDVSDGFDTEAASLVVSNELLLEYAQAAQSSLRQALFTLQTTQPEPSVIEVDTRKMQGGTRRYETKGPDAYIFRVGGNSKIHDGESTRLMTMPGRYRITVTASAIDKDRYPIPFPPGDANPILAIGVVSGNRSSFTALDQHEEKLELKYEEGQTFQVERWIDREFHPYLRFVNGPSKPITLIRSNIRRGKLEKSAMREPFEGPGIRVSQYKIEGPYYDQWPPESVRTTLSSSTIPNLESSDQRTFLLGRFATRAYRRRVTREEITPWADYLNKRYEATHNWQESIIQTMMAMMASPDFLYLSEQEGRLSPFRLASRLSYFFWSTMPDHDLFQLANSGELSDPKTLQRQVAKMLDDPRSRRFSNSFVDQWLALDTLGTMPPDSKQKEFRVYKNGLESAMLEETRRFFRYVLDENRSVRDFIDSDYTFLDERLANLYGVPFQGGDGERNEKMVLTNLPQESGRGGVLTHASVLTLTSNGVETSPVTRGMWVLDHFLGTPPPPPPKEVPALVPDLNGAATVRQLLEKHRSDAACMTCHKRIDPPGFALEAYDPIGRLRTKYSKRQKVSTEGKFRGKDFDDIEGLKRILSSDVRLFARNLIVRIAEYAKGRKLVAADYPTVDAILKQAEQQDFKLKEIIYRIAMSDLMTSR